MYNLKPCQELLHLLLKSIGVSYNLNLSFTHVCFCNIIVDDLENNGLLCYAYLPKVDRFIIQYQ